jgi:agmatine/peptidylarginine deiminase
MEIIMNQTILFTPVGGTDPISLNNYHDGSILHICRFYKPDKVILYMSKEMLDFQEKDVLSWLAELMKHRDAADSKRYRMLAAKFIDKYGIDTDAYDVIKGWRANASYFYIAKITQL